MRTGTDTSSTIVLRGGVLIGLTALQLLWKLEDRGLTLRLDPQDGALLVSPRSRVTPADDQRIRAHRDELIELVRYCEAPQG